MAPGIVSAASDNDPTTVASLAVIGSTTTYALGWLVLLVIPMLAIVQAISSQIGAVTKCGLEDLVRRRYGRIAASVVLLAVLFVNVLTFAADLEGGGAALHLLTGVGYLWWIVPLASGSVALLVFGSYAKVERFLVYIPLAFITYVIAAFFAHPDWGAVIRGSFIPHLQGSHDYVAGAIALMGTTLTAYAYVWQGLEISEERPPLRRLGLVQIDATFGAVGAGITFWFIVIATGATLGVHRQHVDTAAQAASALTPVAGRFASLLFGIGLLGSALLALPVLLATSGYVVSEMFRWVGNLNAQFFQARRFYATIFAVGVVGCAIAFAGIPPIRLLFASSIAGGIATPITLVFMLLAAADKNTMKEHGIAPWLRVAGMGDDDRRHGAAADFSVSDVHGTIVAAVAIRCASRASPAARSFAIMTDPTNEERRARALAVWQELVDARSNGRTVQARVKAPVKGGLLVDIEGYRGFLPASQIGAAKGASPDALTGTIIPLKVLDVDEQRKRVIVSHRRALQEQRRNERDTLVRSLSVGQERDALVVRLTDFGAFVELGAGVDALIPASELAFERVEMPANVLSIGDRLTVRVLRIENGGKRIAVSRKAALIDPWRQHAGILKTGNVVEGTVRAKEPRLEVEIAPGVIGSVSEREADPAQYEIGETMEVSIRSIDHRARRLRLSTLHSAASVSSTSFAPLGVELTKPQADRT